MNNITANPFGAAEHCAMDNWAAEYAKKLFITEAAKRTEEITAESQARETADSKLRSDFTAADNTLCNEYKAADEELDNKKVNRDEYATETTAGIVTLKRGGSNNSGLLIGSKGELAVNVSPDGRFGLTRDGAGQIKTYPATEAEISMGTDAYKPIVPKTLKTAVESIVGKSEELTTKDKTSLTAAVNELDFDIGNVSDIKLVSNATLSSYLSVINVTDAIQRLCGQLENVIRTGTVAGIIDNSRIQKISLGGRYALSTTQPGGIYFWIPDEQIDENLDSINGVKYADSEGKSLFKTGYLYVIDTGEGKSVMYSQYDEEQRIKALESEKLRAEFVAELPQTSAEYSGSELYDAFEMIERMSEAVTSEAGDTFVRITSANNAGNKYGLAHLDFSAVSAGAASVVAEMDFRMPVGRWYIGLADLSKRPGTSQGMNYNDAGVIFHHGTKNGSTYCINGVNMSDIAFLNKWLTMKVTIDLAKKSYTYTLAEKSSGSVLKAGGGTFTGTEIVTGIELYTWTGCSIDIMNVKVITDNEVDNKTVYITEDGEDIQLYMYKNGEQRLIGGTSQIERYSVKPKQVGEWIDGTPVWRVAIPITAVEDIGCTNPETKWSLHIDVLLTSLNIIKDPDDIIYLDDKLIFQNDNTYVFDCFSVDSKLTFPGIYSFNPDTSDWTTHFYGWIEFATPESNLV